MLSFDSMLCDMNIVSLETSYKDLREVHNSNVIVIMRGGRTTFPFAVAGTNVMAKTVC